MEINSCPRCSSKMGPPLKSGRQVCANCGWSTAPARSELASGSETGKSAPPPAGILGLLQLLVRIIGRTIAYGLLTLKQLLAKLLQSGQQRRSQSGQLWQSLNQKLSNLEEAIPTASTLHSPRWMTPEAAFKFLGGDPSNLRSEVSSRQGNRQIKFNNFMTLDSEDDFREFGLEYSRQRRDANQPCLRWIQSD